MFRRLDEAWRLYRIHPTSVIVSGGHANPFTPSKQENQIACEYLLRWGVPTADVIAEPHSRDTFESAIEVHKLLQARGWTRYLLVTSAVHMPRQHARVSSRDARADCRSGRLYARRVYNYSLEPFPVRDGWCRYV